MDKIFFQPFLCRLPVPLPQSIFCLQGLIIGHQIKGVLFRQHLLDPLSRFPALCIPAHGSEGCPPVYHGSEQHFIRGLFIHLQICLVTVSRRLLPLISLIGKSRPDQKHGDLKIFLEEQPGCGLQLHVKIFIQRELRIIPQAPVGKGHIDRDGSSLLFPVAYPHRREPVKLLHHLHEFLSWVQRTHKDGKLQKFRMQKGNAFQAGIKPVQRLCHFQHVPCQIVVPYS